MTHIHQEKVKKTSGYKQEHQVQQQDPARMKIRETHRVVFMGSGRVGKTSLITQFMEGLFESTYRPTVEDYHRHNIKTPGKLFHLPPSLCLSLSLYLQ